MATQTETLLPLIDPVDIVDKSIECVEVFLFKNERAWKLRALRYAFMLFCLAHRTCYKN